MPSGLVSQSRGCTRGRDQGQIAAPGKFEVPRLGALRNRNDGMTIPYDGYSASNFTGSAPVS